MNVRRSVMLGAVALPLALGDKTMGAYLGLSLVHVGEVRTTAGVKNLFRVYAPRCAADVAPTGPPPGDCAVDVDDLVAVILGWGPCP